MSKVITINEKEYELIKRGSAQAEQVIQFTKWLSAHALPIFQQFATADGAVPDMSYTDMFMVILDKLTPEALVELFRVLTGCSKAVAKEHFDVGILFEAAEVVWESQPGVRSIVSRFFSTQDS